MIEAFPSMLTVKADSSIQLLTLVKFFPSKVLLVNRYRTPFPSISPSFFLQVLMSKRIIPPSRHRPTFDTFYGENLPPRSSISLVYSPCRFLFPMDKTSGPRSLLPRNSYFFKSVLDTDQWRKSCPFSFLSLIDNSPSSSW